LLTSRFDIAAIDWPGFDAWGRLKRERRSGDAEQAGGAGMIGDAFDRVLKAAAGGDEHAFAELWRDLQPGLLRYLRVMAPAVAEDLASETWLDVIRGLTRFEGSELGFRAWVFTVARHRVTDWRRRMARQPAIPIPADLLPQQAAPDDPAGAAMESISTAAALALIAELPPDQAEVVALRSVAGLDVARVAEIVGKQPGAVRVLAHRGLRRLAQRFGTEQRLRGGVTQ
jgi:RNA polymerase sigma-70 factor (ECF subfamily)